jgi:hypothetical protein
MIDILDDIHIEHSDLEWLTEFLMQAPSPDCPAPGVILTPPEDKPDHTAASSSSLISHPEPDPHSSLRKAEWTPEEDLIILATFRHVGTQWHKISTQLPGRTPDGVRNRWHRLQRRHGLGESSDGRRTLDDLLASCGVHKDWIPPTEALGSASDDERAYGKATDCRTKWSAEEDAIIYEGVRTHGCRWRQISAELPGRSDSSVRNRWRRLEKDGGRPVESADESEDAISVDGRDEMLMPPVAQAPPMHTHPTPPSLKRSRSSTIDIRDLHARPADKQTLDLLLFVEQSWREGGGADELGLRFGRAHGEAPSDPSPDEPLSSELLLPVSTSCSFSEGEEEEEREDAGKKRCRPMWSTEEDLFIVRFVHEHGRVWSKMAEHMPGRSHRAVRNRWLRMETGQATRAKRIAHSGERCYRCRRCGEPKLGHICSAGLVQTSPSA